MYDEEDTEPVASTTHDGAEMTSPSTSPTIPTSSINNWSKNEEKGLKIALLKSVSNPFFKKIKGSVGNAKLGITSPCFPGCQTMMLEPIFGTILSLESQLPF
jgi:hypothetical protein